MNERAIFKFIWIEIDRMMADFRFFDQSKHAMVLTDKSILVFHSFLLYCIAKCCNFVSLKCWWNHTVCWISIPLKFEITKTNRNENAIHWSLPEEFVNIIIFQVAAIEPENPYPLPPSPPVSKKRLWNEKKLRTNSGCHEHDNILPWINPLMMPYFIQITLKAVTFSLKVFSMYF